MARYESLMKKDRKFFLRPDCSMATLGDALGLNRTYTSQFVNEMLGKTFRQLRRVKRLEYAMELMKRYPDKTNREIMIMAGFTQEITFRRAFIEQYGKRPSEVHYEYKM